MPNLSGATNQGCRRMQGFANMWTIGSADFSVHVLSKACGVFEPPVPSAPLEGRTIMCFAPKAACLGKCGISLFALNLAGTHAT